MNQEHALSRRNLLQLIGIVAGPHAVYETMVSMGLLHDSTVWAGPPRLARDSGKGQSVLILGAGIGGLTAAYELVRAGYDCRILEAQERVGGRCITARRGARFVEQNESGGTTVQVCRFDEGLYANLGPARIPHHHRRVLHYCRELNVPLEVFVNSTSANLFHEQQSFGATTVTRRQIEADSRGYISELLAKAIKAHCLDDELTPAECSSMLELLGIFGDLERTLHTYNGSTRSGCRFPLTVFQPCEPLPPLPRDSLLRSTFWKHHFYQPDNYDWQPTMFQPKNGMDQIAKAFHNNLSRTIHTQAEVQEIAIDPDRVTVKYKDLRTRKHSMFNADYCISNIPLSVLKTITANLSDDFRRAVDDSQFVAACKIAWQANTRFWERNGAIYGGISFINHPITQLWYPSHDMHSQSGVLLGAYNNGTLAEDFGRYDLATRLSIAREGGIHLHSEFADHAIVPHEKGLSIAWQNVPFQRGAWSHWEEAAAAAYSRLLAPDRRFYIVGEQVSMLPGWQEGAMMSAEHVVEQIAGVRPKTVPDIKRAPDTKRLIEGLF